MGPAHVSMIQSLYAAGPRRPEAVRSAPAQTLAIIGTVSSDTEDSLDARVQQNRSGQSSVAGQRIRRELRRASARVTHTIYRAIICATISDAKSLHTAMQTLCARPINRRARELIKRNMYQLSTAN